MLLTQVLLPFTALLATATAAPTTLDQDLISSLSTSLPPSFNVNPYNDTPLANDIDLSTSLNTTTAILDTRNPVAEASPDYFGATPDRSKARYNGPYTYTSHYCGEPRKWATVSAIQEGESYLYGVKGQPRLPAKQCGRVSCSYNSAIFVCNDNNHDISLRSWGNVAEAAVFLTGACFKYFGSDTRVGGQVYFKERWNVIITVQKC